jgi:hypothetical protein
MILQSVFCPQGHQYHELSYYICAPSPYRITRNNGIKSGKCGGHGNGHCGPGNVWSR